MEREKETAPEVNIRPRKLNVRAISDHSSNMVQLTRLVHSFKYYSKSYQTYIISKRCLGNTGKTS